MTYLAVFDSESWHLDNGVLARAAARDWPAAEVLVADPGAPGSEVRAVEVRYASAAGEVEVRSHVDGRCLYLDGPLELVADFVVWYRGLVPSDVDVVFCDDSYGFDGIVAPGAGRDEVMAIGS